MTYLTEKEYEDFNLIHGPEAYRDYCRTLVKRAVREFEGVHLIGDTPSNKNSESTYFSIAFEENGVYFYQIIRMSTHYAKPKHHVALNVDTSRYRGPDAVVAIIGERLATKRHWKPLTMQQLQVLKQVHENDESSPFSPSDFEIFRDLSRQGLVVAMNHVNAVVCPLVDGLSVHVRKSNQKWRRVRRLLDQLQTDEKYRVNDNCYQIGEFQVLHLGRCWYLEVPLPTGVHRYEFDPVNEMTNFPSLKRLAWALSGRDVADVLRKKS